MNTVEKMESDIKRLKEIVDHKRVLEKEEKKLHNDVGKVVVTVRMKMEEWNRLRYCYYQCLTTTTTSKNELDTNIISTLSFVDYMSPFSKLPI